MVQDLLYWQWQQRLQVSDRQVSGAWDCYDLTLTGLAAKHRRKYQWLGTLWRCDGPVNRKNAALKTVERPMWVNLVKPPHKYSKIRAISGSHEMNFPSEDSKVEATNLLEAMKAKQINMLWQYLVVGIYVNFDLIEPLWDQNQRQRQHTCTVSSLPCSHKEAMNGTRSRHRQKKNRHICQLQLMPRKSENHEATELDKTKNLYQLYNYCI